MNRQDLYFKTPGNEIESRNRSMPNIGPQHGTSDHSIPSGKPERTRYVETQQRAPTRPCI